MDLLTERLQKRSEEFKKQKAALDPNEFGQDPKVVELDEFKAFVRDQIKYLQVGNCHLRFSILLTLYHG